MESEDVRKRWEAFFASSEEVMDALYRTVSLYPEEKTIPIKYEEINMFDHELGSSLLEDPTLTLDIGKGVVLATAREFEAEFKGEINLRPYKLPPYRRVMVKDLRAEHIGKLVTIHGLVRKVQNVMPKIVMAKFRCSRCGSVWTVPQDGVHITTPIECSKEEGGCGSSAAKAGFNILWHESKYIDTQVTTIQEIAEELIGGEQPQQIDLVLADDLTGKIMPGDKLKITGIIRPKPRRTSHGFMSVLRTYIDVVHVKIDNENKYEDIEFSREEIRAFKALAKDPKVYDIIKDSLAPELMGLDDIKKTIILQLFGGIRKKSTATKMDLRGDIHVLLVGDPGTGKSQLLKQARGIAPRGIFASGKSSTGAGLTAAAVKESTPFGEGVWTLEAGALVLSDMGLAAVDELDKMGKEDRSSMHEAMEQQSISIAKAGITATLQSRCAILAAANPKIGIYDDNMRIDENINLPPTLISRFDTIFILQDKPDEEKDAALAKHILGVHRASEISTHRAMLGEDNVQFSKEEQDEAAKGQKPPLDGEFLRKYIAYAKKNYSPVLTEEAMATIKSFFVDVRTRAKHSAASGAPITARQLEAVIRLGEASAKARLSNNVEHQDIHNGIGTIKNYLNRLFGTEEEWDAISLETAITSTERNLMSFLIETIKKEDTGDKAGVSWKTIEDKAIAAGYTGDSLRKVKNELKRLKKINSIYSPRDGHYRVVRQE